MKALFESPVKSFVAASISEIEAGVVVPQAFIQYLVYRNFQNAMFSSTDAAPFVVISVCGFDAANLDIATPEGRYPTLKAAKAAIEIKLAA